MVLPDVPFPFRVSFCGVLVCVCHVCARPRGLCRHADQPLCDNAARSVSILSDSLYRVWIGFFPPANWPERFLLLLSSVIRYRSCHGNYLHLQSVIIFFFYSFFSPLSILWLQSSYSSEITDEKMETHSCYTFLAHVRACVHVFLY